MVQNRLPKNLSADRKERFGRPNIWAQGEEQLQTGCNVSSFLFYYQMRRKICQSYDGHHNHKVISMQFDCGQRQLPKPQKKIQITSKRKRKKESQNISSCFFPIIYVERNITLLEMCVGVYICEKNKEITLNNKL